MVKRLLKLIISVLSERLIVQVIESLLTHWGVLDGKVGLRLRDCQFLLNVPDPLINEPSYS